MAQKIFFFDIDDTLTSEVDHSIPASVTEALLLIRSKGDLCYVNTGRTLSALRERFRVLPFDGFVCGCGTSIYDREIRTIWKNDTGDHREEIRQAAESAGADVLFEGESAAAFSPHAHPVTGGFSHYQDLYAGDDAGRIQIADEYDENYRYDKFIAWTHTKEEGERFRALLGDSYDFIERGMVRDSCFYEIVPNRRSKAAGMETVAKLHGVDMKDTYAFGDSTNDYLMLKAAGHAIVMGNSEFEELKAMAEFVTDKASEDGLLKAVRRIYRS